MAKFVVFKDHKGEFRWRLEASGNNEIIATSGEGYTRKENCLHGIDVVKNEAPGAKIEDITAKEGAARAS